VSLAASACGGKGNQFAEVCDKRKNKSSGNYDKVEITTNILTGRGEPALSAPTRGHSDFRAGGHNWNGQLGNGAIWYSLLPITILLEPNAPAGGFDQCCGLELVLLACVFRLFTNDRTLPANCAIILFGSSPYRVGKPSRFAEARIGRDNLL